jgi:hypothetical protein
LPRGNARELDRGDRYLNMEYLKEHKKAAQEDENKL